jgi:hypothetical protein
LIAALVMGPDLGLSTVVWPGHPPNDSQPPTQSATKSPADRSKQAGPVEAGGQNRPPEAGHSPTVTGLDPFPTPQHPTSTPTTSSAPSALVSTPIPTASVVSTPAQISVPIKLKLLDTTIEIGKSHTSEIGMSAEGGTVHWSAVSSQAELVLGADTGAIPKGGVYSLVVTFRRALIQTPGTGQITVINQDTGDRQVVTVRWPLSLL